MGDRLYELDISENSLTIQELAAMPLKLHESLKNEKRLKELETRHSLTIIKTASTIASQT